MSDDEKELQTEQQGYLLVKRLSDLKKREAALESMIVGWKSTFQRLIDHLSSRGGRVPDASMLANLPTGDEIRDRLKELQEVSASIAVAKTQIAGMGLNIE